MKVVFPEDFLWGAATSSYQIEGGVHADGRSESIWDRFAATPGKISDGSDGSVACEHYARWADDVALMKGLGLQAYRFSIAWPRVLPAGRGSVNRPGLDFYERLVDGLLEAGIEPVATLYHWDLPQVLEDKGGWTHRDTASAFVDYTDAVTRRLGDRVSRWITHNEPWCASMLGYLLGEHAPGYKDGPMALAAAHVLLLSHGMAVPVIRGNVRGSQVGITLNLVPAYAASSSEADQDASRAFDGSFNRWFLDPVYGRGYPADVVRDYQEKGFLPADGTLPFVEPGDLDVIAADTDFLGVNYYSRAVLRSATVPESENAPVEVRASDNATEMGWEVYPDGLRALLVRVHRDYAPRRIDITENGAAYGTAPDATGAVPDLERLTYVREHLRAVHAAIEEGVPVGGYFLWSLLDNFEWAFGYEKRFGMVWVDYETQARIPKASALWYRDVIASGGRIEEGT